MQAVSITFFRFSGLIDRYGRSGRCNSPRQAAPDTGIGFHKLFGTGTGEGFTPVPKLGVYAVLATWPDLATAPARRQRGQAFRDYRGLACESATVFPGDRGEPGALGRQRSPSPSRASGWVRRSRSRC